MSANLDGVTFTVVLTPMDMFAGRSMQRFGVGEQIKLGFLASPPMSAGDAGGLRWYITSGLGVLTGGDQNDGTALYTAPASAGNVILGLRVVSGDDAGTAVATSSISVVAPQDGLLVQIPGTTLSHTFGTWSCGFDGEGFLFPKDVSFSRIMIGEGGAIAQQSGLLLKLDPVHPAGPPVSVGPGDSSRGCKILTTDTVASGVLPAPFSNGDFLWQIPWEYTVDGSPRAQFTTAEHHSNSDENGTATISKKGAGPFSKLAGDPDS